MDNWIKWVEINTLISMNNCTFISDLSILAERKQRRYIREGAVLMYMC